MKIEPNEGLLKIAFLVFNCIFGILSVTLLILGIIYFDDVWWPREYDELDFLELSTLLIILGVISLFLSIVGCLSIRNSNRRFLIIFASALFIILCLELTIGVVAFLNENDEENAKKTVAQQILELTNGNSTIIEDIEATF